jgi:hypothetical protein
MSTISFCITFSTHRRVRLGGPAPIVKPLASVASRVFRWPHILARDPGALPREQLKARNGEGNAKLGC